ncbi:MAG: SGNH/GDSL hydrolase family protein [Myxococcales bacterium]|nr:SGNH/GDSL hydrolase family protein [Myxococcales bacterium]
MTANKKASRLESCLTVLLLAASLTGCAAPLAGAPVAPEPTPPVAALTSTEDGREVVGLELTERSVPPASLALVVPVTAQAEAPSADCPAAGTRVLLVGDSLSHGLAPHLQALAERCGTPYFHHGVVGSHVTQWSHWIAAELDRAEPTVVVMSMGGNDFERSDPERVREAIPVVVDEVEARGARFFWISPPTMPFPDRIDVRGMWHDALASRPGSATFPAETLDIPRGEDRIHPTRRGNVSLSADLWRWISSEAQEAAQRATPSLATR